MYTDGSKIGDSAGATGGIFVNGKLVHQLKCKLHGHCSNNQAEQIGILKTLEILEELQEGKDNEKRAAIYTDSKITLVLLQNKFKRNRLIELIRNRLITLGHLKWIVHSAWVKGHAGIGGNELVDRLAKEADVENGAVVYDKIPKEVIVTREKGHGLQMWEQQWMDTRKGAVKKAFSASVKKRLTQKIPIFPVSTNLLKGHGNINSYIHRLGLRGNRMCPCEEEEQTVDHLIFKRKKLRNQRNEMIRQIKKTGGNWRVTNKTIINN